MSAEEATVNPDGSATFEEPPVTEDAGAGADEPPIMDEEKVEEIAQGIDPAVYLLIAVVIFGALYYFFVYRKKKDDSDSFFAELDGDKVRRRGLLFYNRADYVDSVRESQNTLLFLFSRSSI